MTDPAEQIQALEKRCETLQKNNAELLKTVTTLTSGLTRITAQVDRISAANKQNEATARKAAAIPSADEIAAAYEKMSDDDRAAALVKASLRFPREIRPGAGGPLKGLR